MLTHKVFYIAEDRHLFQKTVLFRVKYCESNPVKNFHDLILVHYFSPAGHFSAHVQFFNYGQIIFSFIGNILPVKIAYLPNLVPLIRITNRFYLRYAKIFNQQAFTIRNIKDAFYVKRFKRPGYKIGIFITFRKN